METGAPPPEEKKKKAPLPKVVTLNKALKLVSSASSSTSLFLLECGFLLRWCPMARCSVYLDLLPALGFVEAAPNLFDAIAMGKRKKLFTHGRFPCFFA
jgi:hypothetical protein